jgi:hypothetical protein
VAKPIWNGAISFGLLNVPVQIYSGERTGDLRFRMLDSRDRKPIRYERVNADTGEEVAWQDIVAPHRPSAAPVNCQCDAAAVFVHICAEALGSSQSTVLRCTYQIDCDSRQALQSQAQG